MRNNRGSEAEGNVKEWRFMKLLLCENFAVCVFNLISDFYCLPAGFTLWHTRCVMGSASPWGKSGPTGAPVGFSRYLSREPVILLVIVEMRPSQKKKE